MNAIVRGAKGGSKNQRTPKIANDTAASKTFVRILYGMSEGEVEGLAKGLSSIYLDDTPIEGPTGGKNFEDLTLGFRAGTNDQEHIEGFEDISSETAVGVELKDTTPWVKAISDTSIDAVSIRLKWGALRKQNAENGDVAGITIEYAIDVQTDGGVWETTLETKISDKTSANYERQHRIGLPRADRGWQVRVRRITPNSTSEYISDKMYVQAITEVVDLKLAYPNTALVGVQYDAEAFSNIAKIAVELKGIKLKIPSNYDPIGRKYNGIWDGTFKRAYSNNPAWIYYDICTAKRYALGDRLTAAMIDKWALYRLAQYCDQLVPDGKGGEEPRFTCNVYIQSTEDAYSILMKLAGVFRAISYWDGNSIVCDADLPQDTMFTYTAANILGGAQGFEYGGTRARDRHTVAKVAWDNPQNRYKTEYVHIRDEKAIGRIGVRVVEIDAWGCTSEGQAQRAGQWALKSEQLETRTVTFKVGLDGHIPQPGKVIEIADPLFAGRANGGRIAEASRDLKSITIDRDDVVCRPGDRLVVNGESGKAQARIVSSVAGRVITVVSAFDNVAAQNVWVVDAKDLATMKFRVMSISQSDKHQFTINALQYNSAKYDAIDHGAFIDERPISIINPTTQDPVESVAISSEQMVQQGMSVETMVISWPQAKSATKYQVEWRKDDGAWLKLPVTGNNSAEVAGIYAGNYEARVIAISAFDISSLPTHSVLTELKGKEGKPPKLAFIRATGILFGMKLDWGVPLVGALDTAYVEINVSPDGKSNIAQLGLFAYPTTTHTIQGLQPNLKQFYQGRLVDRIGNKGEWSDWVSGTTVADAKDVLDLLHEQISESQLSKDLQTKIERIDTIEVINNDLSEIKNSITDTKNQISQETQDRQDAIQNTKDGLSREIKDGDDGVLEIVETNKQSTDEGFVAIQSEIKTIADDQKLLAEKTDGVYAQVNPELIGSVNDLAGNGEAFVGTWSVQSAMIEGDLKLSKRIDTTVAETEDLRAQARQETIARIDGDKATVEKIDTYIAENDDALSSVRETAKVAVEGNQANGELITAINLELKDKASTGALEKVESNINEVDEKLSLTTTKLDGVYAQINPEMIGSIEDLAGNGGSNVGVWSEMSARIEGDMAQAKRTDQVVVEMQQNSAAFKREIEALVDADKALATSIETLQAQVGDDLEQSLATIRKEQEVLADAQNATAKEVETVQTVVDGNTASIKEQKQSIDGIYAEEFIKTDVNGHVAGRGSANDGKVATMIFNYDAVHFGAPVGVDGIQSRPLMSLQATPLTLPNGTVIPRGVYIEDGSFGYINADRIWANELSAISADLGTIKVKEANIDDLAVTSAKIADLAVDTLKIKDNAVTVPVSAFADTAMGVSSEYSTIQTLNVPSDMGHTILTFGAVFSFNTYDAKQQILCRILKNGNAVFEDLEVYFLDSESTGYSTSSEGAHTHDVSINSQLRIGNSGGHSHGVNGNIGYAGGSNMPNHSHGFSGSTQNSGDHSHNLTGNVSASVGFGSGQHKHTVQMQSKQRGAGTLNISRHDSTLIAGVFQLQLRVASGGTISVSQRYIHAMTMRK